MAHGVLGQSTRMNGMNQAQQSNFPGVSPVDSPPPQMPITLDQLGVEAAATL